jgi:hypothetical protein
MTEEAMTAWRKADFVEFKPVATAKAAAKPKGDK